MVKTMKWQAVFFDFDGVILDSVSIKTEAFAEMFRQYGSDVESKVVEYHLANAGVSRYKKFVYFYENFLDKKIDNQEVDKLGQQFSNLVLEKVLNAPYIDGALETLKKLQSMATPSYVVTGTPENEIHYILDIKGLSKYFRAAYGAPKSKNVIVQTIITNARYTASKCLFIGDAMTDYNASVEAGTQFLGIVLKGEKSPFPPEVRLSEVVSLI